jgi:hypothetical protein
VGGPTHICFCWGRRCGATPQCAAEHAESLRARAFPTSRSFANKYGAQRALIRNGDLLSPSLLIGVRPIDPRHRQALGGVDDGALPLRPKPVLARPYRLQAVPAAMPARAQGVMGKVWEHVFGF